MGTESQTLKELCEMFLRQEYDLEEFQSRLETSAFPIEIEVMKHDILNVLEEIRFTKLEMNHYRYGAEAAQRLLNTLK